jgi:crossover junction endodeoxyribonuclease RusA
VRLTLPYPPSVNDYWRAFRNRVILTSKARKYKAEAARIGRESGFAPLSGPIGVFLRVYRPRRIGDLDNTLKATLDALRGVCFVDDRQVQRIEAERFEDKANPRVEIEVEELLP